MKRFQNAVGENGKKIIGVALFSHCSQRECTSHCIIKVFVRIIFYDRFGMFMETNYFKKSWPDKILLIPA